MGWKLYLIFFKSAGQGVQAKEDIFVADDGRVNARSIGSGLDISLFQECRSRGSSEDCLNIGTTVEGDIVAGLDNVDAILVGQETLACHGNKKVVIQRITEESVDTVIIAPDTETVNVAGERGHIRRG